MINVSRLDGLKVLSDLIAEKHVSSPASVNYTSFVLFVLLQLILRASAATYRGDTLSQCCFNAAPSSVAQHWVNVLCHMSW